MPLFYAPPLYLESTLAPATIVLMESENLYREFPQAGNAYRQQQLQELQGLIEGLRHRADERRGRYFAPDTSSLQAYHRSTQKLRGDFLATLGWPLCPAPQERPLPPVQEIFVAEDALGKIYRLLIPTLPGLTTYGLFFLPPGKGPHQLVISQHGGQGTPERCSDFYEPANYSHMTRRLLRRRFAVFAPQLLLWLPEQGPKFERRPMDQRLKHLGSSITAIEIFRLQRSLDYLLSRPEIVPAGAGMVGLSYGGFYTLFLAAADKRIKAALSSCFFNDRYKIEGSDWLFDDSASRFLDGEVAALICPRPLYIEVGKKDNMFPVEYARPQAAAAARFYRELGVPERLVYHEHEGGHELDPGDAGMDFLEQHLRSPASD